QTGGLSLNSTSSAPPRTRKPRMKVANTAGPSPESAKAKLSPQRSHLSRSTRPRLNRAPSPQCGQRPFSPAASTDAVGASWTMGQLRISRPRCAFRGAATRRERTLREKGARKLAIAAIWVSAGAGSVAVEADVDLELGRARTLLHREGDGAH